MEQESKDPHQSRVSTAAAEDRNRQLADHQINNFKNQFSSYYQMMAAGFNDNDEGMKNLTKPDFFVKNVIGSYYDNDSTPILKEKDVFTGKLLSRLAI